MNLARLWMARLDFEDLQIVFSGALSGGGGIIDTPADSVLTLNGAISGSGGLKKINAGALRISGNNAGWSGPVLLLGSHALFEIAFRRSAISRRELHDRLVNVTPRSWIGHARLAFGHRVLRFP